MDGLVYDKEALQKAVTSLLDQKYGKVRTDVVRGNVLGTGKCLSWFSGARKHLRIFLDIAKQPGGRLWILDLLDMADRKRETVAEEIPEAVARIRQAALDARRRTYIRETAAILTEMIRREERGEPQLDPEGKQKFLERRRAYWNRRTEEYLEAAKLKPEKKRIGTLRAEIASILLQEELGRYRQAKEGIYKLSTASQKRLNNPRDKQAWFRADTAMAHAFREASQK